MKAPGLLAVLMLFCFSMLLKQGEAAEFGRYDLDVGLRAGAEYGNNLRLLDANKIGGEVVRLSPTFKLRREFAKDNALYMSYNGRYEFSSQEAGRQSNSSLDVGAEFALAPHNELSVSNTFAHVTDPEDNLEDADRPNQIINRSNLSWEYDGPRRLDASLGYQHTVITYIESTFSDRDQNLDTIRPVASYEFYRDIRFRVEPIIEVAYFDEPNERDYFSQDYVAGLVWKAKARLEVGIDGGYQNVDYDDSTVDDFEAGIYGGHLKYQPVENIVIDVGARRDLRSGFISDSSVRYSYLKRFMVKLSYQRSSKTAFSAGNQFLVSDRAGLEIKVKLLKDLTLRGNGSYTDERRPNADPNTGVARRDKVPTGYGELLYRLNDRLSIGANYEYQQRASDDSSLDYVSHQAGGFLQFEVI